jgi:hypothetical protein
VRDKVTWIAPCWLSQAEDQVFRVERITRGRACVSRFRSGADLDRTAKNRRVRGTSWGETEPTDNTPKSLSGALLARRMGAGGQLSWRGCGCDSQRRLRGTRERIADLGYMWVGQRIGGYVTAPSCVMLVCVAAPRSGAHWDGARIRW